MHYKPHTDEITVGRPTMIHELETRVTARCLDGRDSIEACWVSQPAVLLLLLLG